MWHILILSCSGGLAYTCEWRICYKPQSTTFHNIYCQSCVTFYGRVWCYIISGELVYIYCINSLAICKGSTPSSLVLIFFLSVYRQSFNCITFPLKNYLDTWCIISNCRLFDFNNKFCELYNLTENLAVEELIVLYKGRVVFQQYIPKKHKRFGIKIYKLCYSVGYTYMSVYLGKQRQHAAAQITATHATVLQFIRRVEGLGHKIFMDNYFTSPAVFDLFQWKINVCGTVHHDRCGMPWDIEPKYLKMKRGDIATWCCIRRLGTDN